tara:strand:- start:237 stop:629 length:393 start_codon:yes stop_codon:yes gene_type:complete
MMPDNTKEIDNKKSSNPMASIIDVERRSGEAVDQYPEFFGSVEHQNTIDEVKAIVKSFFPSYKELYVNHRVNRGHPMTVIKVAEPKFPNTLPTKTKERVYKEPLERLGVETVFAKGTNSYLYRIKHKETA